MGKIKKLIYVLIGTLVIVSCTDTLNDENGNKQSNEGKATLVSLYSNADCSPENLLASKVLVKADSPLDLDLNVPIHCENVYMKYTTSSGDKVKQIPLNNSSTRSGETLTGSEYAPADFDWTTERRVTVSLTLPENAVLPTSEEDAGFRFYHNTGVVMFEDNWPKEDGKDNDLNDVVCEYDLKITECQDEALLPGQGYKEGLLLTLDIRAKGGRYPTKIGLALEGLDNRYIKKITSRIILKAGQGVMEELVPATDLAIGKESFIEVREINGKEQYCRLIVDTSTETPIIEVDGLSELAKGDDNFFQVTKGHVNEGLPMLRAEIKLEGRLRSELDEIESTKQLIAYRSMVLDTKSQNFYIVTKNQNHQVETHLKGYEPTYKYTNYAADVAVAKLAGSDDMMTDVKYCNKNGFVWGIKVPAGVKHVYEKTLVFDAYPKLKGWIESNGTLNKDWYTKPDDEKVVRYW